ncbi:CAP domain-containing protein [Lacrimispora sp. 210928-DFI.3.58]|uniref:CAP domain-containing protein n=1 Tax=Lacrimispora sp. 210928-DFI.3.58 TaxID=2883214 RepID=UPI0015B699DB|nr:CAP domain-containing protein [Lacrimispora sp. 210928-DFI.3.58]MCB7318245.1 CAP domain-containing protein [Lacrimispora sp. 210928-DFI.3.58]
MRKTGIYGLAAALAVTAASPMTAMAANIVCKVPGAGQKLVIGGNPSKGILAGMQVNCDNLAEILGSDCLIPGNGGGTGEMIPGQMQPGQMLPGQGVPGQIPPVQTTPDEMIPDHTVPDQTAPDETIPDVTESSDSLAAQVAELVNKERAKAGLSPLTWNTKAASAARTRAEELTASFSHTRPNGSSFSTALTEAGLTYSRSGENIAYGQTSAEQVMEQWMNSSGHRANILDQNFTSIGVGHYVSPSGVHYWTQLFTR